MNKFIFTCGDINGIGPEIVIKALNILALNRNDRFLFACPANIFEVTAKTTEPKFKYIITDEYLVPESGTVAVISKGEPLSNTGIPTEFSGDSAFKSIELSCNLAITEKVDAMITAPISKTALKLAGYNFPGHTEMLAEWCGIKKFSMMFLSGRMNAALATIHEPVKKIAGMLNAELLAGNLEVLLKALKIDLRISEPKIALLGLNPHAGENGNIGKEEQEIIVPFINNSTYKEYLSGPFSPDAFFANKRYLDYDLVLGMYHDQVLIPFKLLNFGAGVNFTAGLPIVRTSPDHGTAFDIAGKGKASEASILQSFRYAKRIAKNRKSGYA